MKILENVLLSRYTTFRTGGPARYFVHIRNVEDLKRALVFAKEKKVAYFILGLGANVLVPDSGFGGLVIKMEIMDLVGEEKKNNRVRMSVGAGFVWDTFVAKTVREGACGIENLSLIPSTVGASAFGNIGAYGVEVKNVIFAVEALNTETLKLKKFSNAECAFEYRTSFFKTIEGKKYIITKVIFDLRRNGKLKTGYKDVQEYLSHKKISTPSQKQMRDTIISIRKNKLPDIKNFGTAGSFFMNPIVNKKNVDALKKKFPEMPVYPQEDGSIKISAGYVLDKICGYKGYKVGDVGTWEKQALVLVNYGNATTNEILAFANEMQKKVKEQTDIDLIFEVQRV